MSGYYYPPTTTPPEEGEFDFNQPFQMQGAYPQQLSQAYAGQPIQTSQPPQRQLYAQAQPFYQTPAQQYPQQAPSHQYPQQTPPQQYPQQTPPQQFQQQFSYQTNTPPAWMTPTVPSNYPYDQQSVAQFPQYTEATPYSPEMTTAGPSKTSAGYLSPDEAGRGRVSRSTSFASVASSARSYSQSDVSRSVSPNASEMAKWGIRNDNGTWSCAYPGCSSRSTFNRGCDLRKHYKRHTKSLFCRIEGCPQATEGGFSSKKDRARHEAKHNPNIVCEWEGCDRLFSRVDNMVRLFAPVTESESELRRLTIDCRRIMSEECTSAN